MLIDTFVARNESNRAIDVYYRLIDLSPDTINARARLAELLKNNNQIDPAAEQLAQVASAYFRMGQTNKALEEYRRGLQWAPNSAPLHAQYGQALLKLERFEAALGEFRRALELDQNNIVGIARVNATLALIGAIVAEFFGSPTSGLGFRISTEAARMNMPLVWGAIVVAAVTGSTAYALLVALERRAAFWHPSIRGTK